ncbi:MAG: hypothetical protein QOC90_1239, partial [Mycobacterium sp.]|nr:hypothetical protein [Mycobacterium sp.]
LPPQRLVGELHVGDPPDDELDAVADIVGQVGGEVLNAGSANRHIGLQRLGVGKVPVGRCVRDVGGTGRLRGLVYGSRTKQVGTVNADV